MLKLIFLLFAQPSFAACGCQCVDGIPKTLCQTIVEAQAQPRMCPPQLECPVLEDVNEGDPSEPLFFDAPSEQAHSCREVRIWDAEQAAYTGVRVCDVIIS